MKKVLALLLIVTAMHAAVSVREAFVVDEDLVDILTNKGVHIKLYHEFVDQNGRRPDQEEYDDMLTRYQDKYKALGRHPDIAEIVQGDGPETQNLDKAEEVSFWVFYSLLGIAFLSTLAIVGYVLYSRRASPVLNF